MPSRNKSNGVATVSAAVTVPLGVNGHAAANGDATTVVEKPKKEPKPKPEKPPVVYAQPIQPLERVVYPYVCVTICGTPEQHGLETEKVEAVKQAFSSLGLDALIGYSDPLTAVDAMALIGWEVEAKDGPKFGDDWAVKDYYDKKVRLHKNIRNRPIYPNNLEAIVQNILNCRWELNGEPTIVSDVGNVLDNQHTLVGLCIAQQRLEYEKGPDGTLKWAKNFPDMVVKIPKVIIYGIKGTDTVVNTMNTGKPRTFADVLYRSPYFSSLKAKSADGLDRENAARVTDRAVKEVWQRTGMYMDGFSSKMTNSEGSAWLENHGGMEGKFLESVRHILDEDVNGHISNYIPCGKATCLMWLSGCGKSDQDKYYSLRVQDRDSEAYASLKWQNWNKAKEFWKEFGDREPDKEIETKEGTTKVRGKSRGPLKALTDLLEEMRLSDEPLVRERDFLIARAWGLWAEEKPITAAIKIKDNDYGDADPITGNRQLKKEKHQRYGTIDLGMDRIKEPRKTKELDPIEAEKAKAEIDRLKAQTQAKKDQSGNDYQKELEAAENDKARTTTSEELGVVKSQAQKDCEMLAVANPDTQFVLMKTVSGRAECWGPNAPSLAQFMGVEASQHPNDSFYLKLDVGDWETIVEKVNGAGYSVGLGDRVEGKLEMVMSSKPSPKGNGRR